jgi:hypothetical protein
MPPELDAASLLALWERACGQPAGDRDDALLRAVARGAEPPRALSERNARFMEIHTGLFGRYVALRSHCPACGTVAQFTGDCDALAGQLVPAHEAPSHRLEVLGHVIEFRLPDSADVTAASNGEAGASSGESAASSGDAEDEFVWQLLDRCVLACTRDGAGVPVRELPPPVLDALSQRMEALDPGASVSFAVTCPQCEARWLAPLDAGQLVWQKVQASAERLLFDVDALARAYGWSEAEVLGLSPLRRAAYLQMVTS